MLLNKGMFENISTPLGASKTMIVPTAYNALAQSLAPLCLRIGLFDRIEAYPRTKLLLLLMMVMLLMLRLMPLAGN